MGGVRGRGSGREEGGRRNSSLGGRSGILQGGGGGRRCIDRGFLGPWGCNLREFETDCFWWTREGTRGFQSMSPGSNMKTIATIRGMDHKKSGEETEGN